MPVRFKYVGDAEREIPSARLVVKPGDEFEVADEVAKGLEGQSLYEPVKAGKSEKKENAA